MSLVLHGVVVHRRDLARAGTVVDLSSDGTWALVEYGVAEGKEEVREEAVRDLVAVEGFADVPDAGLKRVPILTLGASALVSEGVGRVATR